jgi:hypothetical protein
MKLSGSAFQWAYLGVKPKQAGQWAAITGYANSHTYSHTAVFISLYSARDNVKGQLKRKAASQGTILMFISVIPERGKSSRR